jgi:hypothetical protein
VQKDVIHNPEDVQGLTCLAALIENRAREVGIALFILDLNKIVLT